MIIDPVTGDNVIDVLAFIDRALLNQKCLDHGFVKVLDCMPRLIPADGPVGCDFAIADAARISYQKGTRKVSADAGLIDNLIRNRHTSPIEMGELKFHIRLPIFVMRQHVRHRMASLNEESARYSELASDFYVPDVKDWAMNTAADKQATVKYEIDPTAAKVLHEWITTHNQESYQLYKNLLEGEADDTFGVGIPAIAREQARMVLGVNIYTQCVWKIDLKNLLHYLSLRCDKHAQYEIRVFADAIARVVAALFPAAYASHKDHDPFMDGVNFGASELKVLHKLLAGDNLDDIFVNPAEFVAMMKEMGWGARRFAEFKNKVDKAGFLSADVLNALQQTVWGNK